MVWTLVASSIGSGIGKALYLVLRMRFNEVTNYLGIDPSTAHTVLFVVAMGAMSIWIVRKVLAYEKNKENHN